jgi:hypothetical protein
MPSESNHPWSSYPIFVIKQGDDYYSLSGETPKGEEVIGIPVFGDRTLAEEQIEADEIDGTILELDGLPRFKEDTWLFYFADEESEMAPVKVSSLRTNNGF